MSLSTGFITDHHYLLMLEVHSIWQAGHQRLSEKYDEARSRYLYRAFDAAITAELGSSQFAPTRPPLVAAGSRGYRRTQKMANLAATLLPSAFERFRQGLFDSDQLPLANQSVSLLSYGSGVTVFILRGVTQDSNNDLRVLKVFRKSLGRRRYELMSQVLERRTTYERVMSWYEGCAVVLPTHFLILHGPLLSRAAAACIQPYVGGEKFDLFDDIHEEELVRLLTEQAQLRSQFHRFTERTLHAAGTEGACIDLVGRNNLILTAQGDQLKLLLLDLGVYDFEKKAGRSALLKIQKRLAYLERVHGRVAS